MSLILHKKEIEKILKKRRIFKNDVELIIYRNINMLVYKHTIFNYRGYEVMKLDLLDKSIYVTRKEYIYRMIRKNIMDINLKPGEAISENELAIIFETSRTPIREALSRLSDEGLIEIYPQKGTFVSLIDLNRLQEAKFMRINLEREIIKQACTSFPEDMLFNVMTNINQQEYFMNKRNYIKLFDLDNEMHEFIYIGCKKKRIWSAIRFISGDYDRIRTLRLLGNPDWEEIIEGHKEIANAIREKKRDKGIEKIIEHLTMIDNDVKYLENKYPSYFKNI